MRPTKRSPEYTELDRGKLWWLPAGLSLFGLFALPFVSWVFRFESGSLIRDALAGLVAFGCCASILGLGLAVWIALRVRNSAAVVTAVVSVAVAALWWRQVFLPMIEGGLP